MELNNKKYIVLKKQKHINDLRKIFDDNKKELDAFEQKIYKTHVTNFLTYQRKIKMVKIYSHKYAIQNTLNAKISHAEIELKKASLSSKKIEPFVLTPSQLNLFINWFNDWINYKKIPFMPHVINSLNRIMRKSLILDVKTKYFEYVKIPQSDNRLKTKMYKIQLHQLNNKIKYFDLKFKEVQSFFWNKYLAKLVKKLQKSKKDIGTSENEKNKNYGIIHLENVSKYYANGTIATKVLKDVNLSIKPGEFVVIVGQSGSGKTTLLNIISGMDRATYGKVIVAGENLINYNNAKLTDFRRRNIGYVFQQYALLPNLTVIENVEIGQYLQKDKSKRMDIDKLLKSLDIYEQRNKFPHELSGGQQQRVSIARSMAKNPIILFGDEPTGAVDEATSKNILDMFVKLNKEHKTTIVIVTHNQEITKLASTVIRVKDGYVYQQK